MYDCKVHGVEHNVKDSDGKWRCRPCRSASTQKYRRKNKEKYVEYKGGQCERCGYSKCLAALEFHHKDPTQKDFAISAAGKNRAWESVKPELDKCMLVCSNCHKEIHEEILMGVYSSGYEDCLSNS